MTTILFIHPSSEMYGSDKVLLALASRLNREHFRAVVAVPSEGPLTDALRASGIETHIVPLLIVGRKSIRLSTLFRLPFDAYRSLCALDRVIKNVDIDIVHSNTLAVLSGALWAMWRKKPHVWHVHEIILRPWLVSRLFPLFVRAFSSRVVANSKSTLQWLLGKEPRLDKKSTFIWNGLDSPGQPDRNAAEMLREEIMRGAVDDVLVALVGRINRMKGQILLVEAAELIKKEGIGNIHYLIVGGTPPGQEHFRDDLIKRISSSPAREHITLMDFRPDIHNVWGACDIAVVPSTEPESFGLVALEAMAAGKPVIGAEHGGLTEIVKDGETGLLFLPSDKYSFADKIHELYKYPLKRTTMGMRGKERLLEHFSMETFIKNFSTLYADMQEILRCKQLPIP